MSNRLFYSVILIATFVIGVLVGYGILVINEKPNWTTILDMSSLVVNIIIGTIIAIIITKKYTDDRGVKDYFIQEIVDIIASYRTFRNKLISNQFSSQQIITWSKEISMKVDHLEHFLKIEFEITGISLMSHHRNLHKLITKDELFNDSFNKEFFKPDEKLKSNISKNLKDIKYALIKKTVKINRA